MMLARASSIATTRATTSYYHHHIATAARRRLVTSSQKRALNKEQLEGSSSSKTVSPPPSSSSSSSAPTASSSSAAGAVAGAGGGASTKPADITKGSTGSPGGGGGGLFGLLAIGSIGIGGAYYMNLIPDEYVPDVVKDQWNKLGGAEKNKNSNNDKNGAEKKAAPELKEVVQEVTHAKQVVAEDETTASDSKGEETATATDSAKVSMEEEQPTSTDATAEEEEVTPSIEHPENGNRVDIDKISSFYQTVLEGRQQQQQLEEAQESASNATAYNESYETTSTTTDPSTALSSATNAMNELQSSTSLESSHALAAARAALRSDLDREYFEDLDTLKEKELRIRVVQLATEMADRTKWEAVRLKEFLAMKEKEVGEKYLEILQKQRLEFESLLAQKLREQEDTITRQANAALQAKEESIQSLLQATSAAREQETKDILASETNRIAGELELKYESQLQNELALQKENYAKELDGHVNTMNALKDKLGMLESRLEVSRNYESGSKKAHRVSAAALALANKLEVGEGAAVEIAALKGAAGEEGVIASAVKMIPRSAEGGVPTVTDLQATFDKTYVIGRQAAMVPEGRSGLEGQLLGMLFAKLSVPPSPDAVPTSEEEGSVTDGILSLARKYVQLGDLEKAVEQLDKLQGQTAFVMNDWKTRASDRVSTERALKVIKLECALLNKDLVNSGS